MWDSRRDDYYATLQAVSMLATLKSAGVNINQASFNRALDYLNSQFNSKTITANPNQITMIASALLSQNSQASYSENARAAIINLLAPKTRAEVLGDQLSNHSLAQLAIILSRQDFADALSDINAVLDNRITIDSRGAFLRAKSEQSFDRDDYETTIGDTALYLRALAIQGRDTVYTDKIVRWLLQSRDRDGAWGSTQNTLAVVEAFVEFLKLFDTLIGLTSIQQELYSIALEVGKVRRRVNALEYVTIPNLQETIAYIEEKLEEMERENTTRLLKIKDIIRGH